MPLNFMLCMNWNRMKRQKNVRDFEKKFITKTVPVFYFFLSLNRNNCLDLVLCFSAFFSKTKTVCVLLMSIEKNWYCSHLMSNQFKIGIIPFLPCKLFLILRKFSRYAFYSAVVSNQYDCKLFKIINWTCRYNR